MSRLAVEHVSVRLAKRTIIDDVSLTVDDGEMLTMLGPSGAGKTTLLRTIAGLEPAVAGRILLNGRDIMRSAAHDRRIGLVFADFALFPHLPVRANIGFGVRSKRRLRVLALAERFGLTALLDRYPAQLSRGEQQRVAVARALAVEPDVLLYDEPFASLDAPLRAILRLEIAEKRAAASSPAIFVTHDQDEAVTLGDRMAIVDRGRIVALDRPAALAAAPPTAFVARFLGRPPANVFDGTVSAGRFQAAAHRAIGCAAAPSVTAIALRPERIRTAPESDVNGRIRFIETIGAQRYATVNIGGFPVAALTDGESAPGMTVGLTFDYRQHRAYDAAGDYVR